MGELIGTILSVGLIIVVIGGALLLCLYGGIRMADYLADMEMRPAKPKKDKRVPRKHRKHTREWAHGWNDIMDGTTLVKGSDEHRAWEQRTRRGSYSARHADIRSVEAYTDTEWEAYLSGREAARVEKKRRDIIRATRVDHINRELREQEAFETALREIRAEHGIPEERP